MSAAPGTGSTPAPAPEARRRRPRALRWLKARMPKGLYQRAALIVAVPMLALQIVVSLSVLQKHFAGVAEQMSAVAAGQLQYAIEVAEEQPDVAAANAALRPVEAALGLDMRFVPQADVPDRNTRRFYDFSGLVIGRVLSERVPELARLRLPDDRRAVLFLDTLHGPLRVEIARVRLSATNPHQLLIIMAVFGALTVVVSYVYLRNQMRPIAQLAHAAEAFGEGRAVAYRPAGAREVRAAGAAFLDMRARIRRHMEQRTLILSGVSHDLRTPLTRMRLGLSMMDDDEARDLVRDVDEMQGLVDAFLGFAGGAFEDAVEPTDPAALVRAVVRDAVRMGRAVTLTGAEDGPEMLLRPAALRRALDNLIGNAVRYGRRAEVSLQRDGRSLTLAVEDDGPGIPEDRRADALKPFSRLDPARNQDAGSGVGLGLAITADIARAHGGALRLERSDRLGGLRAVVTLTG